MKNLFLLIPVMLAFSSCAAHIGTISSSPADPCTKYNDMAYGIAQTKRIAGIGGLRQDALVLEARRELVKNRPLVAGEQYANYTIDFKNSYFPFFVRSKVTVSADIICIECDTTGGLYSEIYKKKLFGQVYTNELFEVGDTVYYSKRKQGTIVSLLSPQKVKILYSTGNDKVKSRNKDMGKIYSAHKPYNRYKPGDPYVEIIEDEVQKSGYVLGTGLKSILVKNLNGGVFNAAYKE